VALVHGQTGPHRINESGIFALLTVMSFLFLFFDELVSPDNLCGEMN
jgi:hypothetical protein